ncbi:MAG: MBL fold metallo-hydrolase [Phycisphaerales bacterium]|nr:MBL fold metallo-hydrolase [Phycisphaerales bacterium]
MKLRFFGAAGEVTGSCTLVETARARVLVDFGMHQGGPQAACKNMRVPPFRARDLDAVVLTHAHIDHSGRLPMLIDEEYKGPIHATPASIDLCDILLKDSAQIQQMDMERLARRRSAAGRDCRGPLYSVSDVDRVMQLFRAHQYGESVQVAPGIGIRYHDAGHILGSAWVEMTVEDGGRTKTIVFSGDIGPYGAALLRDPEPPPKCDVLILESTYGDRDHKDLDGTIEEMVQIMRSARTPKGKVLIPSFAVGRTQQLIYFIGELKRDGRLEHPIVYVDSPMAIEATGLYRRHRDLFDAETWAIINSGESALHFDGLRFARTGDDSRAINPMGNGVIVLAASGMCTGGRILHHLKHNLGNRDTHVIFAGYQGEGTLGRKIVNGEKVVRVMGEPVHVEAHVHTLGGFSAHAGQSDLVRWATPALESRPRLILNHGEDRQRGILASLIQERFGVEAAQPHYKEVVDV